MQKLQLVEITSGIDRVVSRLQITELSTQHPSHAVERHSLDSEPVRMDL